MKEFARPRIMEKELLCHSARLNGGRYPFGGNFIVRSGGEDISPAQNHNLRRFMPYTSALRDVTCNIALTPHRNEIDRSIRPALGKP
jgi:hypothetical protein